MKVGLISKIAEDDNGRRILSILQDNSVHTGLIRVVPSLSTASTFIIISRRSMEGSDYDRTCIHTPLEELSDLESLRCLELAIPLWPTTYWFHLDSRHTQTAIRLCSFLKSSNTKANSSVLISLDAERMRPGLSELLTFADIIFTNNSFIHQLFPNRYTTAI